MFADMRVVMLKNYSLQTDRGSSRRALRSSSAGVEQLWFRCGQGKIIYIFSYLGFQKDVLVIKSLFFCCLRVTSDKVLSVCESWCRFSVVMCESNLPSPTVVLLYYHRLHCSSINPPVERHPSLEKVTQTLLLRRPFCYGSLFSVCSNINPCSLSLSLRIALKWICLVLAQCAMKLLWCDPIQY